MNIKELDNFIKHCPICDNELLLVNDSYGFNSLYPTNFPYKSKDCINLTVREPENIGIGAYIYSSNCNINIDFSYETSHINEYINKELINPYLCYLSKGCVNRCYFLLGNAKITSFEEPLDFSLRYLKILFNFDNYIAEAHINNEEDDGIISVSTVSMNSYLDNNGFVFSDNEFLLNYDFPLNPSKEEVNRLKEKIKKLIILI